jgi:hypothetical protein
MWVQKSRGKMTILAFVNFCSEMFKTIAACVNGLTLYVSRLTAIIPPAKHVLLFHESGYYFPFLRSLQNVSRVSHRHDGLYNLFKTFRPQLTLYANPKCA